MCSFYTTNDNFIYGTYFKRYKEKDNNPIITYYMFKSLKGKLQVLNDLESYIFLKLEFVGVF